LGQRWCHSREQAQGRVDHWPEGFGGGDVADLPIGPLVHMILSALGEAGLLDGRRV
jgi:hypothetical protein